MLVAAGLHPIETSPPVQFGGPGDRWSPETLLLAAVSDCFVLTYRAVARAAQLPWISLDCEADGVLDRVERTLRFTGISLAARLVVPEGTDRHKAMAALHQAERQCLISNSLLATQSLSAFVQTVPEAALGEVT